MKAGESRWVAFGMGAFKAAAGTTLPVDLLEVVDDKVGAHRILAASAASQPARPCRANSTTASSTQPVQNSQCVV